MNAFTHGTNFLSGSHYLGFYGDNIAVSEKRSNQRNMFGITIGRTAGLQNNRTNHKAPG
jgi:hypothetical protein